MIRLICLIRIFHHFVFQFRPHLNIFLLLWICKSCQKLTRWLSNNIILMSIAQSLNNALYFVKMYSNTANAMLCFSNCCHWKQYGMYCIIMSIFLENCPQFPIQNIIFLFPTILTQANFDVALKVLHYYLYIYCIFGPTFKQKKVLLLFMYD